ncbi:MAG TPA: ribonuclease III [Candidatus Baltobacteraceae bacterium]|jgi:ribonuclease III|nr:ribonuclease III [Candidatus Baltobacteraceae bacterium]
MTEDERAALETTLGYRFQRPDRLERALTHRSLRQSAGSVDNERLEFLGDRVLGLVASERLLSSFPEWDAGSLSKGLARLVSASSIHAAAQRLHLGPHLRLGPGEEKTGGREKKRLLADAYEAILGAIYLDGGLAPAAAFLRHSLLDRALNGEVQGLELADHKSALQEWLQQRGLGMAEYRLRNSSGPEHQKTFEVEVWHKGQKLSASEGRSKKEAEQDAARIALGVLEESCGIA